MTHLYERLNNNNVAKVLLRMIENSELNVAKELFDNITEQAKNHPRYPNLLQAYQKRIQTN